MCDRGWKSLNQGREGAGVTDWRQIWFCEKVHISFPAASAYSSASAGHDILGFGDAADVYIPGQTCRYYLSSIFAGNICTNNARYLCRAGTFMKVHNPIWAARVFGRTAKRSVMAIPRPNRFSWLRRRSEDGNSGTFSTRMSAVWKNRPPLRRPSYRLQNHAGQTTRLIYLDIVLLCFLLVRPDQLAQFTCTSRGFKVCGYKPIWFEVLPVISKARDELWQRYGAVITSIESQASMSKLNSRPQGIWHAIT